MAYSKHPSLLGCMFIVKRTNLFFHIAAFCHGTITDCYKKSGSHPRCFNQELYSFPLIDGAGAPPATSFQSLCPREVCLLFCYYFPISLLIFIISFSFTIYSVNAIATALLGFTKSHFSYRIGYTTGATYSTDLVTVVNKQYSVTISQNLLGNHR